MYFLTRLTLVCALYCLVLSSPVKSCDHNAEPCLETITKKFITRVQYKKIINGDPDLGIENLDPLLQNEIEEILPILNYTLHDTVTTGFNNCKIINIKLNPGLVSAHFDLICEKLEITGKYKIHGKIATFPIEGEGDFTIDTNKYNISVDVDLEKSQREDGKHYLLLKNFILTAEPMGPVQYDLRNLFNGQKEIADPVLKFVNENWYDIAKQLQGPVLTAHVKKIIKNINILMKQVTIEELEE